MKTFHYSQLNKTLTAITSWSDSELELLELSSALVLDTPLRPVLIFLLTLISTVKNKARWNKSYILSDSLLLSLDDLFVDGNLQRQSLLDLDKFLVVRPLPLNLPVEEADLALFRLDLMERRRDNYIISPTDSVQT